MPRLQDFLSRNGPWDQLLRLKNIELRPMQNDVSFKLNHRISITPFLVSHRDEHTETVGFRIAGPQRSVVFINLLIVKSVQKRQRFFRGASFYTVFIRVLWHFKKPPTFSPNG